ncbi:MAG: double zinc ribbon domain-containing protein [Anaerolineales bacterium]
MNRKLSEAFELYKRGEKQKAAKLLAALVVQEPNNTSAWLGLGVCIDDQEKQIFCFNKALSLDPNNAQAKVMLAKLSPKLETKNCPYCGETNPKSANLCANCGRDFGGFSIVETEISEVPVSETQSEEPKIETNACPYCGEFNPEGANWCRNCGRDLRDYSTIETDRSEESIAEPQPAEPRIDQTQVFPSLEKRKERIKISSYAFGAVLIIGLIGVLAALIYVLFQMNPIPITASEPDFFTQNPTNPSRPPATTSNPLPITGSEPNVFTSNPTNPSKSPAATPNPSSITPPYFEDFSNGAGIWHVREDDEVSFSVFDGRYVINPKLPGGSWWTSPRAELGNIRLEFTTSFGYTYPMEDGGFRVNFRCQDIDEELCYIMTISENGYLFVHRDADIMVEHKLSQFINLYDHPNEWVIVMDGSNFEIYCNGELLATFSDDKYKFGDFGFGVFNSTDDKWGFNGVAFDNIRVTSLD